jgi:hypothetical protein
VSRFRQLFLAFAIFGVCWFNVDLHRILGECEKAILQSRGLNVTDTSPLLYCQLPFDECLCSVLSNKSHTSEKCVTKIQLISSRILPLISFVLEICLVREFFSLNGDYRRVIIYVLWIASIFIFVGMTIGIYWSSCYHVCITLSVSGTNILFCYLSLHNVLDGPDSMHPDPIHPVSNCNQVIIPHESESTNSESRSWQHLLWTKKTYDFFCIWLFMRVFFLCLFFYNICYSVFSVIVYEIFILFRFSLCCYMNE